MYISENVTMACALICFPCVYLLPLLPTFYLQVLTWRKARSRGSLHIELRFFLHKIASVFILVQAFFPEEIFS